MHDGTFLVRIETALTAETKNIIPVRILNGPFMGSMNMPGFSISLTNLSNISESTSVSVERLLELIDAPHNSVAWPATSRIYPVPEALAKRKRAEYFTEVEKEEKKAPIQGPKILVEPKGIAEAMRIASEDVITLEPKLTEWDTVSGASFSACPNKNWSCIRAAAWNRADGRSWAMAIVARRARAAPRPFSRRSRRGSDQTVTSCICSESSRT